MTGYDQEKAKEFFGGKVAFTTGTHELLAKIQGAEDIVIVDVRLPGDYRTAHVPGAINLPNGRWQTAAGLYPDKLNILYCYSQTCHLAAQAAVELASRGYPVVEMEGGFATWQGSGYPVEASEAESVASR